MLITVKIATATICFLQQCFPALVGTNTPIGTFTTTLRITQDSGYGGDVIQFSETERVVYAIHRVWLLKPKEQRLQRLNNPDPKQRIMTNGCINVAPEVYEQLRKDASNSILVVEP